MTLEEHQEAKMPKSRLEYQRVTNWKQDTLDTRLSWPLKNNIIRWPKRLRGWHEAWSGGFQKRHLYQYLRRHHAKKYIPFFKILKSQNLENSKKINWASFFGLLFWNSFVGWGLNTFLQPNVSTTWHASFFTVMPNAYRYKVQVGL
jgi:hypothetical protein